MPCSHRSHRERQRILLVVGPNLMQCHRTVRAFGLDFLRVEQMRFVSQAYHLRGWSTGTPFITSDRASWSSEQGVALDQALGVLTKRGQLRPANQRDLEPLREGTEA